MFSRATIISLWVEQTDFNSPSNFLVFHNFNITAKATNKNEAKVEQIFHFTWHESLQSVCHFKIFIRHWPFSFPRNFFWLTFLRVLRLETLKFFNDMGQGVNNSSVLVKFKNFSIFIFFWKFYIDIAPLLLLSTLYPWLRISYARKQNNKIFEWVRKHAENFLRA